ncbi:MAG: flavoprotein [Synergistaceae bacterium]|jgi:flavoprotein|nr:flavoprotein [Synergistaceae bacterium]
MTNIDKPSKAVCWVVTGAGHFLRESVELMSRFDNVDVFMTRAAAEVAARYGVTAAIRSAARIAAEENDYSAAPLIRFSMGKYSVLVIAPATANTVAKCSLGIADSLASNFFAQAGKSGVPIAVLPTDAAEVASSLTPSGKIIKIRPRPVDLRHTDALSKFPGVALARSVDDLNAAILDFLRDE